MENPADLIKGWPQICLDERGSLPDSPGLYACWAGDSILYIGQSATSIHRRWQNHEKLTLLASANDPKISYCEIPVEGDEVLHKQSILEKEIRLIQCLKPPFNKSGLPYVKRKKPTKIVSGRSRSLEENDGCNHRIEALKLDVWVDLAKRVSQIRVAAADLLALTNIVEKEIDARIKEASLPVNGHRVNCAGKITVDPSPVLSLAGKAIETAAVASSLWGKNKILEGDTEKMFFAAREVINAISRHEIRDAVARFDSAMSDVELDGLAAIAAMNINDESDLFYESLAAVLKECSKSRTAAYEDFMRSVKSAFGVVG